MATAGLAAGDLHRPVPRRQGTRPAGGGTCSARCAPAAYLVGDGPLRPMLTQLIRARRLRAVVRLPGWSYRSARYVAGSSVHVVPSREESWSQSAVVGLGLGVPVIGTAVDGLAHTLGDGRGVLVPPEDPPALAAALARVLAGRRPDPGLGRAYAQQFTPSAAAEVYLDAYRHLLASRARSRRPETAAAPPAATAPQHEPAARHSNAHRA